MMFTSSAQGARLVYQAPIQPHSPQSRLILSVRYSLMVWGTVDESPRQEKRKEKKNNKIEKKKKKKNKEQSDNRN